MTIVHRRNERLADARLNPTGFFIRDTVIRLDLNPNAPFLTAGGNQYESEETTIF